MKKLILSFVIYCTTFCGFAQEIGQRVGSLRVAVENQKAKDFVFEDADVKITIDRLTANQVTFNIENLTDKPLSFLWEDSYFIASGRSTSFQNSANAAEIISGVSIKEVNSVSPKVIIAPNTFAPIKASSKDLSLFDYNFANNYYKQNDKVPQTTAVIALNINGAPVEKKISFQMYTPRIVKSLKSPK